MLRRLFLILLPFSLINVANPNDTITFPLIAAYDFETPVQDQWDDLSIISGWGLNNVPTLVHDAEITREGKYGKSLAVMSGGWIKCSMNHPPVVSGNSVSFVTWIKVDLPKRSTPLYLTFQGFGFNSGQSSRILEIQESGVLRLTAFYSVPAPLLGAVMFEIKSKDQDIMDNNWHHIAYSHYGGIHRFYVDGEIVFQQEDKVLKIEGSFTSVSIGDLKGTFTGRALFDDVGIFGINLSNRDIQNIYNQPLSNFINTMPVNPQGRLTTTWGKIKSQ